MASTKGTRTTSHSKTASIGLLANGSSGPWEIAIDESTAGDDRWFAQIEGPSIAFYFEIESLDLVDKMIKFLEPHSALSPNGSAERGRSLLLEKDKETPVTLVKDDEYDDRFFILVGPPDSPMVRSIVAGNDVVQIIGALRQVKKDLAD